MAIDYGIDDQRFVVRFQTSASLLVFERLQTGFRVLFPFYSNNNKPTSPAGYTTGAGMSGCLPPYPHILS